MTTETSTIPHAVPYRFHRAWWRTCFSCNTRTLSDLLLTIHIRCNRCGERMSQPPQGTPPDVDTVTEWLPCTEDGYRCPDHR